METKNLNENGRNPYFLFGTKNLVRVKLVATVLFRHGFGYKSKLVYVCVCVCVCFLPIHSGHQVRWTYQPGSHRRKVTQDFSSTFFLRCVP